MDEILKVKNLTKKYKDFYLDNLSFDLPKGTITGLIGENGSGKTTLIKSLLNLVNYDAEEILFWDQSLKNNIGLREKIGVVFDDISFNEVLTPRQVEKISATSYKNWDSKFYRDFLKKYNIPLDKKISSLSKGMKMKLQCALALSHQPNFLILDEVTSGLDPISKEDLLEILFDFIQNDENSILISSHDINELEKLSDYILFISNGKKIFFKSKDDILDNYVIIRSPIEEFNELDRDKVIAYLKRDYHYDVIVDNSLKNQFKEDQIVDKTSLEEFITIYLKGKKNENFNL